GWDMQDEVIGSLPFSNWEAGFGDIVMRPDLSTFAAVPWEEGCASVICDFYAENGDPLALAPRHVLRRVAEQARTAGYVANMAAGHEVRLVCEDQERLGGKEYSTHHPL